VGTNARPSLQLHHVITHPKKAQQSPASMTNACALQTELRNSRADLRNFGSSGETSAETFYNERSEHGLGVQI
jgi:hypothetical protein